MIDKLSILNRVNVVSIFLFLFWMPSKICAQNLSQYQVDSLRTLNEVPGILIYFSSPDTFFFLESGFTRWDDPDAREMRNDHLMHLGSNTKAFTAILAYRALERNGFSDTAKLIDFLPDNIRGYRHYFQITIGQLSSHNAGIQPFTRMIDFSQLPEFSGSAKAKRLQFARVVFQMKPKARLKEEFVYSNGGYALLALVAESIHNQPWEELIENYLQENEMNFCLGFPATCDEVQPWGHWQQFGMLTALGPDHNYDLPDWMYPAGGLSVEFRDYAKW